MKIMVVGLGSMGKRRIRLLRQYDPKLEIIGVDSQEKRVQECAETFGIRCVPGLEEALLQQPDCACVCTSPLSHAQVIRQLLLAGLNVFTEINLVTDGYEELIGLAQEKKKVLFLSSTFLYRRDIQYMIGKVREASEKGERLNYVYHTGQYLPDWHPWESYKSFFVNDVRTNGCREIMTIEFPWIASCFGMFTGLTSRKGTMAPALELNYPDNYVMMTEHENGHKGIIAVDVVARSARRCLEIFGENLQLLWNGTPDSLMEFDIEERRFRQIPTYESVQKDRRYCENIIENAYMDELAAFIYQVNTGKTDQTRHDFQKDLEVLKWVDAAEGDLV